MFLLLLWLPLGLVVSAFAMYFMRDEFGPVTDFDDFFVNTTVFIGMAMVWPLVILVGVMYAVYTLIYER